MNAEPFILFTNNTNVTNIGISLMRHRYIGNIDAFKIRYTYRFERPKLMKYRYGEK